MKLIELKIPLKFVKLICVLAVLAGLFSVVLGKWVVGLCMLLGSYLFEKSNYICPHCKGKLNMKAPVFPSTRCPHCLQALQK